MIYKLIKRVIQGGGYEKADMQNKLDVYLAFDRITQEQYEELAGLLAERQERRA